MIEVRPNVLRYRDADGVERELFEPYGHVAFLNGRKIAWGATPTDARKTAERIAALSEPQQPGSQVSE